MKACSMPNQESTGLKFHVFVFWIWICSVCVPMCTCLCADACLYRLGVSSSFSDRVSHWICSTLTDWLAWLANELCRCTCLHHYSIGVRDAYCCDRSKLRPPCLYIRQFYPPNHPLCVWDTALMCSSGWPWTCDPQASCFWCYRCCQYAWPHFENFWNKKLLSHASSILWLQRRGDTVAIKR